MSRDQVVIIAPALLGLLLLLVSQLDIVFYGRQLITARQAAGIELGVLSMGVLAVAFQLMSGFRWLLQKRWKPIALCALSAIAFLVLFIVAGVNGAAILNAT